jgi:hypothetical protein
MTETERDRITGQEDVEDIKRYQAISRVRSRIEDELTQDVTILEEHHEGLLGELREVVCDAATGEDIAESGLSKDAAEPIVEENKPDIEAEEEVYDELQIHSLTEDQREEMRDNLSGSGELLEKRVDAIEAMYQELQRRGEATSDDLLDVIDPEEVRYLGGEKTSPRDSSWSNLVKGKETLSALLSVEKPPDGRETWKYTGESA